MMETDYIHFNLKTFDIVMTPAFSDSYLPPSRRERIKKNIQNIFKIKKPLN